MLKPKRADSDAAFAIDSNQKVVCVVENCKILTENMELRTTRLWLTASVTLAYYKISKVHTAFLGILRGANRACSHFLTIVYISNFVISFL